MLSCFDPPLFLVVLFTFTPFYTSRIQGHPLFTQSLSSYPLPPLPSSTVPFLLLIDIHQLLGHWKRHAFRALKHTAFTEKPLDLPSTTCICIRGFEGSMRCMACSYVCIDLDLLMPKEVGA